MPLTFSDLFARGAVFALHCGHWRARERLEPSDLGLDDTANVRRALHIGAVRLASADALAPALAIQRKAAVTIDDNSLAFRMIPGTRYVPSERIENLSLILDQLRTAHGVEADKFAEAYPTIARDALAEAYRALTDALKTTHGTKAGAIAERAISRLTRELPPAAEIRRRFYLRWNVYTIDAVDDALADSLSNTSMEVNDVLSGMIGGLRSDVQTKLASLVDLVQRDGKWTEKTVRAAEETLARAEAMNILNDSKLADSMAQARSLIRAYDPKGTDTGSFVENLSTITNAIETDTREAVVKAERELISYSRRKIARREEGDSDAVR